MSSYISHHLVVQVPDEMEEDKTAHKPQQNELETPEPLADDYLKKEKLEENFSGMMMMTPSQRIKPCVVLDAANIGWGYGMERFSAIGIKIAFDFFLKFGIEVVAFIPASYILTKPYDGNRQNAKMQTDEHDILMEYVEKKILTLVPPKESDDAFILNYAHENACFVVSNDHYADHLASLANDSARMSFKIWLEDNRCSYTFVKNSFLINPKSNLAFSLQTYSKESETLVKNIFHDQSSLHSKSNSHPLIKTILHLTEVVNDLMRFNKTLELQFILLTRARLYLEIGEPSESIKDLMFILQFIDDSNPEAIQLLQFIEFHPEYRFVHSQRPQDHIHPNTNPNQSSTVPQAGIISQGQVVVQPQMQQNVLPQQLNFQSPLQQVNQNLQPRQPILQAAPPYIHRPQYNNATPPQQAQPRGLNQPRPYQPNPAQTQARPPQYQHQQQQAYANQQLMDSQFQGSRSNEDLEGSQDRYNQMNQRYSQQYPQAFVRGNPSQQSRPSNQQHSSPNPFAPLASQPPR